MDVHVKHVAKGGNMIISEKIKELEDKIKKWDSSGVSPELAPWHCGMGHENNKSSYQQTLDSIEILKGLLNDNQ